MTAFEHAHPALAGALASQGYATPTEVQAAVLAPELAAADLLVSAQTGSGKTVAFGLAVASTLLDCADRFADRHAEPLALVVAPTRELALQVRRELDWLYAPAGARTASCVGGMDMRRERDALSAGAHIVVGTPGRLRDHIERGSLDLARVRAVVLDEADEMLDLGFREDLEYILDAAPTERRTLMFSATVSAPIAELAKRYQRDAVRVAATGERAPHHDIEYRAHLVAPTDRDNAIVNTLLFHDARSAMVFCGTRIAVQHLCARLTNRGFAVVALSGELSQNERSHALQAMRDGRARVCVATDVAARGIDLPTLDLVIHADIPNNPETLLHRSGRTGRAGRKGVSVLVVPHPRRHAVRRLLQAANVRASWTPPPGAAAIAERDRERMLKDESLAAEPTAEELALAGELLAAHGAERVAAAYLRLHQASRPAPEELLDGGPAEPDEPRKGREDFAGSAWFTVSVGHRDKAEARWLLPLICRAGHVTKNEVGAIRILHNETQVEIAAAAAERFAASIAQWEGEAGGTRDDGVTIRRLEGEPAAPSRGPRPAGAGRGPGGGKGWKPGAAGRKAAAARREGHRGEGHRGEGHRGEGHRGDGGRREGGRGDGGRPGRPRKPRPA
ncbi:DEAD/DEAH box helicase [Thalassobaculum fulvum]|uniref:DEAD/DEAH box helicase n=1 Tax=Thalassobaculum fulvum TaxID=1633335 RepID=A0A918XPM2_9PROT|nr:DEAD/DEAH box helicase [Thalassobaculum fulvum]GHD41113.1 DEAD/DEAH box helicase [Thalassobaculum fulvum]